MTETAATSRYRVRFLVPAEVTIEFDAADEDDAEDRSWPLAQAYLQSLMPQYGDGVASISADLDGIGAESIEALE